MFSIAGDFKKPMTEEDAQSCPIMFFISWSILLCRSRRSSQNRSSLFINLLKSIALMLLPNRWQQNLFNLQLIMQVHEFFFEYC